MGFEISARLSICFTSQSCEISASSLRENSRIGQNRHVAGLVHGHGLHGGQERLCGGWGVRLEAVGNEGPVPGEDEEVSVAAGAQDLRDHVIFVRAVGHRAEALLGVGEVEAEQLLFVRHEEDAGAASGGVLDAICGNGRKTFFPSSSLHNISQ